jgi:alkanesulfonate monooxygenase
MTRLHLISSAPARTRTADQIESVRKAAQWAESAGHEALLIGPEPSAVDSWALAQVVLSNTSRLVPVVSVQPAVEHPYTVARRIATLHELHGRAPHLEFGTRAAASELPALGDSASSEERRGRLLEFGRAVRALLSTAEPVEFEGQHYRLSRPPALTAIPERQQTRFFAAASHRAAEHISAQIHATLVHDVTSPDEHPSCVRLGIIARETDAEAWDAAFARFPEQHSGVTFDQRLQAAWADDPSQTSLLTAAAEEEHRDRDVWLAPFERRLAPCAYFVGSHTDVARRVLHWLDAGTSTFLLDAAGSAEDLHHTGLVFERAWRRHQSPLAVSL